MKTERKCEIPSDELARQVKLEMQNPEWREGFTAFDARAAFTMRNGRDWAMGWLTCRLLGAQVLTDARH